MRKLISTLFLVMITLCSKTQSINTEFGKNRVQYHDDFNDWWEYESENFITYWYGKARFIAQSTILTAEYDHNDIQKVMEHRMNDKIEIIVYVDISDLKQSNIGTEETFTNKTGETKIVGNKMFVYFDGNYQNLRKKIKEGIATVYFNNMLFGSNFQEIIQNAVLLDIPEWYKQGVIAYTANTWNYLVEDELRDIWKRDKKWENFDKIATQFPKIAGHSFWFFIDQTYGKSSISNLLYLTKISRGTENSFEYILNTDLPKLKQEWKGFYKQYFESEQNRFDPPPSKTEIRLANKKYSPISQIKLSPDGTQFLYVHNQDGKFRVVLHDIESGKRKVVFKYGYRNLFQETDFNYPLLAWHPSKPEFSLIYEHRDNILLRKYHAKSLEKQEQIIPTEFQRIYSLSYKNDLDYIMSGSIDGYSDLFLYQSKNRNFTRLSNDFFDDLDAEYVEIGQQKGILFTSNRILDTLFDKRLDTILPTENFDIFFLPDGQKNLKRLTNTKGENERYPYLFGDQGLICMSDGSGIINTYHVDLSTRKKTALSNLNRNLIRHHAIKSSDQYLYTLYSDGMYKFYYQNLDITHVKSPFLTQSKLATDAGITPFPVTPTPKPKVEAPLEERFLFQSTFPDPPILEPIKIKAEEAEADQVFFLSSLNNQKIKRSIEPYNNARAVAANKKFALNKITTKLDNDILFEGLESYTGDRQQLLTTPLGILFKANLKDLFEDYTVEAGVRIPTTFNGSEYFLIFENKKTKIDKRYALYRKSNEYNANQDPNNPFITKSRKTTILGMYQLKYPFDIYRSIRWTNTLRFDRFVQLSTENNSLNAPAANEKRLSLRLEYIFDNTYDASLNIKFGSRYKFYVEAINRFDLTLIDGFKFDPSQGFTGIIGFDARHYIPLLKRSVLAIRCSGATSLGSEKMLYFLGGTENWLIPRFNNGIPIPEDQDFSYKANVFQLRGFDNNIRNGGTFVVSNVECRIPFMQYILGNNRGNAFFKNLQLNLFFDAGLAWHGNGPFSDKNPLNKIQLTNPPLIKLDVEYFRDPLVMGYGLGLRSQLLGYFVKADYAWGIETRKILPSKFYISFGMDF